MSEGKGKGPAREGCANADLCGVLMELAEHEKNVTRNVHKYAAYRKAAGSLAAHPARVRSGSEARGLSGVGAKIARKIDEILRTGKLQKLEGIRQDESARAISALARVSGIGPAKAAQLARAGVASVEQLREHGHLLNRHQRLGLRYLEDFEKKIPRLEVQQIERGLRDAIAALDPRFTLTICGSYRRGRALSGDVDALVTHPALSGAAAEGGRGRLLRELVAALQRGGLVVDVISMGETKFMGVCRAGGAAAAEGRARRLDIRLTRVEHYPCALLYFTGSDAFNQAMRAHALRHRFTLNEYTLRPIGETGVAGEPVPLSAERDVFDYLGYRFRAPHERDA